MDNIELTGKAEAGNSPQADKEAKDKARREKDKKAIANLKEKIPDINNIFDVIGRIGYGTFSTVLLASLKGESNLPLEQRRLYAIKHLIPTCQPNRVLKELKCLVEMGGSDNIVGIELCLRRNESVAFVMPYLSHDHFQDYFNKMDIAEIQNYMKNLLTAIKRVHSFNIIHRDVKPSNFLYNRKTGQYTLVDFGLAQNVKKADPNTSSTTPTTSSTDRKRKAASFESIDQVSVKKIKIESTDKQISAQQPQQQQQSQSTSQKDDPVKSPLKQVNEILPTKISEVVIPDNTHQSPLVTVKASVIDTSVTNRLKERGKSTSSSSRLPSTAEHSPSTSRHVKKEIQASRAGTPGYRPPEVLLKYTDQTTAVDMWAVGVIFISILSGVYPFFKAPDDSVALAEIVTIFGDATIRRTARVLQRQVTMSRKCKPLDIRRLCVRLRNRNKIDRNKMLRKHQVNGKCPECPNCQQKSFECLCLNSTFTTEPCGEDLFPPEAYDLLKKFLEINPHRRISAEKALEHPFLKVKYT